MRPSQFLFFALFSCFSFPIFGQNHLALPIVAKKMRAPLEVAQGSNLITLSNLVPGNDYVVKAAPAAQGQLLTLRFLPTLPTSATADQVSVSPTRPNTVKFTASATQVEVQLMADIAQRSLTAPISLSVQCLSCPDTETKKSQSLAESLANLQITPNVSPQSLIANTLIGGDCFSVSNITFSGNPLALGTFSNGGTNIGMASGMVMATGRVAILPGPNLEENADGGFGTIHSDSDLDPLVDGELNDLCYIEFDFIPTANTVKFDFVFGSEEYCEYVGSEYNDIFGFFISGPGINGTKNLALIPNTTIPVTINTVNHQEHSDFYVNNSTDFIACDFIAAEHFTECELDGWTQPLSALATVVPCATYHIKLAIADVTDDQYDSAVFLRANSFDAGGAVAVTTAYNSGLNSGVESCGAGAIRFSRGNNDLSQALPIHFVVSPASTATAGVDYAPLSSPAVIPAGQTEVLLPVEVFSDGITEGQEKIVLLIDNACECQQSELEYLINDNQAFTVSINQDTTICEGTSTNLFVQIEGGLAPFSYLWSSGDTSQSLIVSPISTTLYSVTVTDGCGGTATDVAVVEIIPIIRDSVNVTLCAGGSIQLNGIVYTESTTVVDTTFETFFCGEITTYVISVAAPLVGEETITLCQGNSVEIGGQIYTQSGTVVDTLTTTEGCDSIVTYTLVVLPPLTGADTIRFCPGSSVTLGGTTYNQPGIVTLLLSTADGCDSLVTYTLELLPQPTRAETITFCPGESVVIGGVTITEPGVLQVFYPSPLSCDTIVTYTLVLLTQPTRSETIGFCPGKSVQLGGNTYTQPGTVVLTHPATVGCDTIVTYTLELLPEPTRAETIRFCPGESVHLGNNNYTEPGIVVLTHPAAVGCDTIVTYTLEYNTPAPSDLVMTCPNTVAVGIQTGVNQVVVNYTAPTASSDCICPGIDIERISGPASGSLFPLGITEVCYEAKDACGQTNSCCFAVRVEEDDPCDTKVIGCMKYELLTITEDPHRNKTYRVRVTNNCPNPLIYTAIQTPSGFVAMAPANGAVYTAPSGHEYLVRNPNFSPFYSVRYRSLGTGIANGESDILRYTLPAQAEVLFINITSRLSIQQYFEAHLNTFYCPIGITPLDQQVGGRSEQITDVLGDAFVFPNPTDGRLNVDLSFWEGASVNMQVFNSQGQLVFHQKVEAMATPVQMELPANCADGLYLLELSSDRGDKEAHKFMVQH